MSQESKMSFERIYNVYTDDKGDTVIYDEKNPLAWISSEESFDIKEKA